MVYGYIRVSTDNQNTQNQKMEIQNFCQRENLIVDSWIEDVISGTKSPQQRKLGQIIMENCKEGDLIICTELSRLGRSLLMIMNTLNFFLEQKVALWTIKDNFRLSDDISSKVISFAFGLAAEIERQLISQRTKVALERARRDGKQIGRRKGQKSKSYKLTKYEDFIRKQWLEGKSKRAIAHQLGCSWETVASQLERMNLITKPVRHRKRI
ncbi:MAG: recombinase family protein [Treponema sp.]|nr:recombinase family protein [Treponema sp.]